jgi:hypothetical protein
LVPSFHSSLPSVSYSVLPATISIRPSPSTSRGKLRYRPTPSAPVQRVLPSALSTVRP